MILPLNMTSFPLVSIPLRWLETPGSSRQGFLLKLFQFLLGRLETQNRSKGMSDSILFQFLLGRLETAAR